jgi:ubiquinone/menaquinone biosynthesis C-methylase UbiE
MNERLVALGRRYARLTTDAVVRQPRLWPLFRPLLGKQFDTLAPHWDRIRQPGHLAAFEAALAAVEEAPGRVLDLGTGTGDAAVALARRFPDAELSAEMVAEARRKLPPELAGRVRFEQADSSALPYPDGSFDLVGLANMIPFFDEVSRVVAPRGYAIFGFSLGPATPIYVPPERLREELSRRGFTQFAEFSAGRGTSVAARKG